MLNFLIILSLSSFASFIPKSFEAQMDQVIQKRFPKKIIKEPLTLKYLFRKNIFMKVKDITYVCNSETAWQYRPPFIKGEKGECMVGKSSKFCYSKIFDALSLGLKKNKLYEYKISGKTIELVFTEKASKELSINKISFSFDDKANESQSILAAKQMLITHLNSSKPATKFEIKSIKKNDELKEADFVFKIPKNTNIVNY